MLSVSCAGTKPAPTTRATPAKVTAKATRVGASPMTVYEQWRVDRESAPSLDVYIARKDQTRRPLVVFLPGSHCLPLFLIAEQGGRRREKSTVLFHEHFTSELSRAHFAVVERRGLKSFGPPPASEEAAQTAANCTPDHGGVSKDERVRDAADAVEALANEPWAGPIYLLGHSEGAYVAGGAAARLPPKALAGVGLLSGPGPTQFFDFLVEARRSGNEKEVKTIFDELLWITGPSASGEYRGAAIERQLSYGIRSTTVDDLRSSEVPIFVANGSADPKSPIESADLFVAEMMRTPARRLRYLILPELDHGYYSRKEDKQYAGQVLAAFLDWVDADKDRSVFLGFPPRSN
jgi:pimeloyl-ACP methyl ester carboxylesterase